MEANGHMARWSLPHSARADVTSVRLRQILPDAEYIGCRDLAVSACCGDWRRIEPGELFVRLDPEDDTDVSVALERGASAFLAESPIPEAGRPQVVVPNARAALGRISQALAGWPCDRLNVIGVSGESASTAAHLIRALLESSGDRVGLATRDGWTDGVVQYNTGPAPMSSPVLASMLAAMVDRGCRAAVLAVSPAELAARVCDGMRFEAALLTGANGNPDDRASLARLVRAVRPSGVLAINGDDREGLALCGSNLDIRVMPFRRVADGESVSAHVDELDQHGARFRLRWQGLEHCVNSSLLGSENVQTCLAAAAICIGLGVGAPRVARSIQAVPGIQGRLRRVGSPDGPAVYADHARTGRELGSALVALHESYAGNVHCWLPDQSSGSAEIAELWRVATKLADRVAVMPGDGRAARGFKFDSAFDRLMGTLDAGDAALIAPAGCVTPEAFAASVRHHVAAADRESLSPSRFAPRRRSA